MNYANEGKGNDLTSESRTRPPQLEDDVMVGHDVGARSGAQMSRWLATGA